MSNPGHTIPNEGAIYHEVSPTKIFALRIFNGFVAFFVGLSFLICLIQGQVKTVHSSADYILATNIIISSLVAGTVSWWYRTGDLGVEKYWFVVLVGCVIIFQCLTTDIYVFHKQFLLHATLLSTHLIFRIGFLSLYNLREEQILKTMSAMFHSLKI